MAELALWIGIVYAGTGAAWLVAMLVLARTQQKAVSIKEAVIHAVGWPYAFYAPRLWWLLALAIAVFFLTVLAFSY